MALNILKLGENGQDIFAQRRCNGTTEAYYGLSWPWDEWDDLSPGCTDNEED